MKARELQKSQFPTYLVNWEKFEREVSANIQKSQFSISSVNWEKLRSPAGATFKNPNVQSLCELGNSLRPRFKSPNIEFIGELGVMS